jgi:hypothetical protein
MIARSGQTPPSGRGISFRVVTLHKVIATGRASGIETVRELGGVIEIRDGLVVSQWIYLDRSEALEAAGLAP